MISDSVWGASVVDSGTGERQGANPHPHRVGDDDHDQEGEEGGQDAVDRVRHHGLHRLQTLRRSQHLARVESLLVTGAATVSARARQANRPALSA